MVSEKKVTLNGPSASVVGQRKDRASLCGPPDRSCVDSTAALARNSPDHGPTPMIRSAIVVATLARQSRYTECARNTLLEIQKMNSFSIKARFHLPNHVAGT